MRIAIDAMGGDNAPYEIVAGAVQAAIEWPSTQIVLVGQEDKIKTELAKHKFSGSNIEIIHAPELIGMDESPALVVRRKKKSSMKIAVDLIKSGDCQGFVTAGNTGAMVAFCTLYMGRLDGVLRAGLAAPMPSKTGIFTLLDAGANISCTPDNLNQYATMATIHMHALVDNEKPRVGLLNIGIEETKGTPFIKDTHKLLQQNPLINYVGYVEGHTIFDGEVDVVITEGFMGNVVLKIAEGMASSLTSLVKSAMRRSIQSLIGAALSRKAFKEVKNSIDVSAYGGAMLLGVNGVAIKIHGREDAKGVFYGIRNARQAVEQNMNQVIVEHLTQLKANQSTEEES